MKNILSNVLFLPCLFILIACDRKEKVVFTEHDYIEVRDREIGWNDVFSPAKIDYFVYFYSRRCSHCNAIKDKVIDYSLKVDNMYFIEFDSDVKVGNNAELTIGKTTIDDLFILGTPSLLEIKDKMVTMNIAGEDDILSFLRI